MLHLGKICNLKQFIYEISGRSRKVSKNLEVKRKMTIFASSESTTLPVRTAYQGGTFLFIATMKYNKQPLDIPTQIAMLKGRGLNIVDEQAAEKTLSRISYFL